MYFWLIQGSEMNKIFYKYNLILTVLRRLLKIKFQTLFYLYYLYVMCTLLDFLLVATYSTMETYS